MTIGTLILVEELSLRTPSIWQTIFVEPKSGCTTELDVTGDIFVKRFASPKEYPYKRLSPSPNL